MKTAEIRFLPVCSECRKIIDRPVHYDDSICSGSYKFIVGSIEPYLCPYCGVKFERISMPTGLPFDELDVFDYVK